MKEIKDLASRVLKRTSQEPTTRYQPEKLISAYQRISASSVDPEDVKHLIPYAKLVSLFYAHDKRFLDSQLILNEPDFSKGMIFSGKVGCGKSYMMKTFSQMLVGTDSFYRFKTAREITREFNVDGHEVLNKYGKESYRKTNHGHLDKSNPMAMCIDDLGAEEDGYRYGEKVEVMRELVQDRYEKWVEDGMITHFTTNLNGDQIEKFYGERVRSRIRHMCNWVNFNGKDLRR